MLDPLILICYLCFLPIWSYIHPHFNSPTFNIGHIICHVDLGKLYVLLGKRYCMTMSVFQCEQQRSRAEQLRGAYAAAGGVSAEQQREAKHYQDPDPPG